MSSKRKRILGAGFVLGAWLVPLVAFSDDTRDDANERSAQTIESTDTPPVGDAFAAERESIEPGIRSDALAAAATRSQSDGQVMDRMELRRSEITGNQELPKVLYIVPWRKAEPSDLMGKPVNTLLDEVLAPIDREEFLRAVDYYDDLYGDDHE